MSVPCGLLLVRQLKDGFHHQGSPQDNDHDLDRNDNVVYKQNYGYASKQSNSIALDYDISKYTKNHNLFQQIPQLLVLVFKFLLCTRFQQIKGW